MALSDYVSITIQAGTAAPTAQGFGKILVLANGNQFTTNEVREYATFSQLAADFDSNTFVNKAAQKFFAQSPRPERLMVGLLPTPSTVQSIRIDTTATTSGSAITGSLTKADGSVASILASGANQGALAADLNTQLNLVSGVSSSVDDNVVTLVAEDEGDIHHFAAALNGLSIQDTSPDFDYDDQLTNLANIDNSFFAVVIDCNSAKNVDKVARWAAANDKMAIFSPQVTRVQDWNSDRFTSAGDLTALVANNNAAILYTKDVHLEAKEMSWASKMLAFPAGEATWAFKNLNSTGTDSYTATEENLINDHDENSPVRAGNFYKTEAGINITFPGKLCGGEYIDNFLAIERMKTTVQNRIFSLFANNKKVPYTTTGANMVAAEIRGALIEAERNGLIDSDWNVTILPVADQDPADRANRILRYAEFSCRLAGAIHNVRVIGSVTV
jgi:hypothetical protein